MSKMLNRRMRLHGHSIPIVVILLTVLTVSVLAAVYVTLQFTITANYQSYPKVTFWQWATSQKATTFSYSINVFAGVKTIDDNIPYGIFNDDSAGHQCNIRISSLSNPSNIADLRVRIYDGGNTILDKDWTQFGSLPTAWESFTTAANTKYSVAVEITGAGSGSGSSAFAIELMENNP